MVVIAYLLLLPVLLTRSARKHRQKCETSDHHLEENDLEEQFEWLDQTKTGLVDVEGTMSTTAVLARAFGEAAATVDPKPFIENAANFELNEDFLLPSSYKLKHKIYSRFIRSLKEASENKITIIAMSDKILLHQMLARLGIAQVDVLLAVRRVGDNVVQSEHWEKAEVTFQPEDWERRARDLFLERYNSHTADFIMKPAGASERKGLFLMSREGAAEYEDSTAFVESMMDNMLLTLGTEAESSESQALKAVRKGVVVQERFSAPNIEEYVAFEGSLPLEVRVQTIWGKAYMGVFFSWTTDLNSCFIIRDVASGRWIASWIPYGTELGFQAESARPFSDSTRQQLGRIFEKHMPLMVVKAELIAAALGTPWLRVDFFVSENLKMEPVVNEVAYGTDTPNYDPIQYAEKLSIWDMNDQSNMIAAFLGGFGQRSDDAPKVAPQMKLGKLGFSGLMEDYTQLEWRPP